MCFHHSHACVFYAYSSWLINIRFDWREAWSTCRFWEGHTESRQESTSTPVLPCLLPIFHKRHLGAVDTESSAVNMRTTITIDHLQAWQQCGSAEIPGFICPGVGLFAVDMAWDLHPLNSGLSFRLNHNGLVPCVHLVLFYMFWYFLPKLNES